MQDTTKSEGQQTSSKIQCSIEWHLRDHPRASMIYSLGQHVAILQPNGKRFFYISTRNLADYFQWSKNTVTSSLKAIVNAGAFVLDCRGSGGRPVRGKQSFSNRYIVVSHKELAAEHPDKCKVQELSQSQELSQPTGTVTALSQKELSQFQAKLSQPTGTYAPNDSPNQKQMLVAYATGNENLFKDGHPEAPTEEDKLLDQVLDALLVAGLWDGTFDESPDPPPGEFLSAASPWEVAYDVAAAIVRRIQRCPSEDLDGDIHAAVDGWIEHGDAYPGDPGAFFGNSVGMFESFTRRPFDYYAQERGMSAITVAVQQPITVPVRKPPLPDFDTPAYLQGCRDALRRIGGLRLLTHEQEIKVYRLLAGDLTAHLHVRPIGILGDRLELLARPGSRAAVPDDRGRLLVQRIHAAIPEVQGIYFREPNHVEAAQA